MTYLFTRPAFWAFCKKWKNESRGLNTQALLYKVLQQCTEDYLERGHTKDMRVCMSLVFGVIKKSFQKTDKSNSKCITELKSWSILFSKLKI